MTVRLFLVDDADVDQGFVVSPDDAGRLDFDLRSAWAPRISDAFMSSGADGLVANYARGFVGRDLDFIRDLPLQRLNVLARTIRDLSPIYDLAGSLEELHVQLGSMTHIDLAALPHLRALSCTWDQVADTIGDAHGIEDLFLGSYDEPDLAPLAHLATLRSLRMKGRPAVRGLDGIESLPCLGHLGIYLAPLEDTTALARISSPVLTELALASCRRITSLSDLTGLIGLRRLDVSEGGTIESLQPITALTNLERLYLYGTTNVADGDLRPLLAMTRLSDPRIMNRRHYKPSTREVQASLGIAQMSNLRATGH